jgi:hypothetical protein
MGSCNFSTIEYNIVNGIVFFPVFRTFDETEDNRRCSKFLKIRIEKGLLPATLHETRKTTICRNLATPQ